MTKRESSFWTSARTLELPAEMLARALSVAADIVISCDFAGTVDKVLINPESEHFGCLDHWVGRDLREFLTDECHPKLTRCLSEIAKEDGAAYRVTELNHTDNAEWEFPVQYTIIATGDRKGALLVGRDLRAIAEVQQKLVSAQLALERDHQISRERDTRYRALFEVITDPVLVIDAQTGVVEDANDAAAQVLGASLGKLRGSDVARLFVGERTASFIERLRASASSDSSALTAAVVAGSEAAVSLKAQAYRAGGRMALVCRIDGEDPLISESNLLSKRLQALYNKGLDAVVFTDRWGAIQNCNSAFEDLCEAAGATEIVGRQISEFLVRGSVEFKILSENALKAGRVRAHSARIATVLGAKVPVDISAISIGDRKDAGLAFVLREDLQLQLPAATDPALPAENAENLRNLVGTSPLKEIVSGTTEVIEKICIETAIDLTNNNRVAVADMLGLSRQSLYVKLRKYGLLDGAADQN